MNGFTDALVCATAADVAAHGFVNVGVGGVGLFGEHRRGGHDLPGLAVAALRHVFFNPGALHGMAGVGRKALDGRDALAGDAGNRRHTGADGMAVQMNGAGSAKRHTAAEFRAREIEHVAEHPEQGHLRADIRG